MPNWDKMQASRLGRSIVTAIGTAAPSASQTTTNFGAQTRQIRYCATLPMYVTVGSSSVTATVNVDAFVPANWVEYYTVTPGQCLAAISSATSTGYFSVTEMV